MDSESTKFLEFANTIGTNCCEVNNLLLIDSHTLAFNSKNYVHFLDTETKRLTSRPCKKWYSIKAIAKTVTANHLAVAENGENTKIFIHTLPNMNLTNICSYQTNQIVDFLSFSRSGMQLAAQCNTPAFEITIWDWKTESIRLQYKNICFDIVLDMRFSAANERYMFTGGVKNLKFWDLVCTFTGLKLLHRSGYFGKFKQSDLLCVCPDDSNRVLTNCEWGNVLVWENDRVKFEICRKNRKACHAGAITQIHLYEDRLYTIGVDNFVRIWFWDTVALADLKDNEQIIEFELTYEYKIPINYHGDDERLTFVIVEGDMDICFIYDGNGAIWKAIINHDYTDHHMEVVFYSNSKDIVDVAVSSFANIFLTIDIRGLICAYDYVNGNVLFQFRFSIPCSTVVWLTEDEHGCSSSLMFGFNDGTIRVYCFHTADSSLNETKMNLIQLLKPHTDLITKLAKNAVGDTLLSSSIDRTVFIYQINFNDGLLELMPRGLILLNVSVQTLIFHEFEEDKDATSFVMTANECNDIKRIIIPKNIKCAENSYVLKNIEIKHIANLSENIDGEIIQIHSLKSYYLWMLTSNGMLHEFNCRTNEFKTIDDSALISCFIICSELYAIIGWKTGEIIVKSINFDDGSNRLLLKLKIPLNENGLTEVSGFKMSSCNQYLFAYNQLGCIIMYKCLSMAATFKAAFLNQSCTLVHSKIADNFGTVYLSLEQQRQVEVENMQKIEIDAKKRKIIEKFTKLKDEFKALKQCNNQLPCKFRLSEIHFEIDERITKDFQQTFQMESDRLQNKMEMKINRLKNHAKRIENAYLSNIEHWPTILMGFRNAASVETFAIFKTTDIHQSAEVLFEKREDAMNSINTSESSESIKRNETCASQPTTNQSQDNQSVVNAFITSLGDQIESNDINIQAKRLYKKYIARKKQDFERKKRWKEIEQSEPMDLSTKNDDEQMRNQLKDIVTETQAETNRLIIHKYNTLKILKRKMTESKQIFNEKVLTLQADKMAKCLCLSEKIQRFCNNHKKLHANNAENMEIEMRQESFICFDGKTFQEQKIMVKIFNPHQYMCDEANKCDPMNMWSIDLHTQQAQLSYEIENIYKSFDTKIETITNEHIEIALSIKLNELHYLTIYQELMLYNQFEEPQKLLLETIADCQIKEKEIEKEIEKVKLPLKKLIELESDDDVDEYLIHDLNSFIKSTGKIDIAIIEKYQALLLQVKEHFHAKPTFIEIEISVEELENLLSEWVSVEKDIQANKYGLSKMLKERENALNKINVVVLLSENDKQKIKSSCADDWVLITLDDVSRANNRLTEYEIETKNELTKQKSFNLQLNQMKSICRKMSEEIASLKVLIHDKMMQKFGMEIDLDEMEETALGKMIANQTKLFDYEHQQHIELNKLKKILNTKNQELLTIKQKQIEKYNLLTVLQEELNAIHAEQIYNEKLREKHASAEKSIFADVKDLERLQKISKRQKQQIKQMTTDIQTLRSKIKSQEQFKLHERVQCERSSPLAVPDDDLISIRSQSLESLLSKESMEKKSI